jgi:predicted AAA+ superfamily ATPase
LSCGWSRDGLKTFNELAREIYNDRNVRGEEFDNRFKEGIEMEVAMTNILKRKRTFVDTYNDLNHGGIVMNDQEESENDDEQWVAKNVFMV